MQLGVFFPNVEIGNDPVIIRDFAQTAEDLGYDIMFAADHVLAAERNDRDEPLYGPYDEKDPFHEPLVLISHLAAITKRILFSTGILVLPQRQIALVAKQLAELALLSGDRIILGIGSGWNHVEYEALGVNFKQRGRILEEQVELLRKLWSTPVLDYKGQFHRVDRAGLNPLPLRPLKIWMGGFAHAAIDRAVRIGDGFIFSSHEDGGMPEAQLALELLDKYGRDPKTFDMHYQVNIHAGPKAWHQTAEKWGAMGLRCLSLITGGPASLSVSGPRFATPREHIAALETFMTEMKQYR